MAILAFSDLVEHNGLTVAYCVEAYCRKCGSIRFLLPEPACIVQCPQCHALLKAINLRALVATRSPLPHWHRWSGPGRFAEITDREVTPPQPYRLAL